MKRSSPNVFFFFLNDPATTDISTLPLHDALPILERVPRELGRLDVLFCNASGPPAAPFSQQTGDAFHRAVELNLLSAVHLARAAVPIMRKLQWGDRKSTRLNSSHDQISYAVFCLK